MRRFEFAEGTSNKFWEIEAAGQDLTIRFGRLGASGQTQLKSLASPPAAEKAMAALIAAKVKKGYVEAGAAKPAKAARPATPAKVAKVAKPAPGIKPTLLAVKALKGGGSVHRCVIMDRVAVAVGSQCFVSRDGAKFTRRTSPGTCFGLVAVDGVLYACGTTLKRSTDLGTTWKTIKTPSVGYQFTILRDSRGTWWMGCAGGVVLTSKKPDKGWKKASFKGPGKVLAINEIDGKLFFIGQGSGVWDGKSYKPITGLKKFDVVTRLTEAPSGALIAVGDDGVAFRSVNRGKAFTAVKSGVSVDLEDLAWVAGALFVVGGRGVLLRSTDEGKTYTKVKTGSHEKLWGIASWGDGAFLGGDDGRIRTLASPKDPFWKGAR